MCRAVRRGRDMWVIRRAGREGGHVVRGGGARGTLYVEGGSGAVQRSGRGMPRPSTCDALYVVGGTCGSFYVEGGVSGTYDVGARLGDALRAGRDVGARTSCGWRQRDAQRERRGGEVGRIGRGMRRPPTCGPNECRTLRNGRDTWVPLRRGRDVGQVYVGWGRRTLYRRGGAGAV